MSLSLSLSMCVCWVFVRYINKLIFISRFGLSLPDLLPDKLSSGASCLYVCPAVWLHNEWIIDKEIIFNWIQIHSWTVSTEGDKGRGARRRACYDAALFNWNLAGSSHSLHNKPAYGPDRRPYFMPRSPPSHIHMRICRLSVPRTNSKQCAGQVQLLNGQANRSSSSSSRNPTQSSSVQAPQSGNKCQMQTARRDQNICPTSVAIPLVPVPVPVPLPISNARPAPAKL